MSIERARDFRHQAEQDQELTERLRAHLGDLEGVQRMAAELGYDCTVAELDTAYREMAMEELDQVAAGGVRTFHAFEPTFTGGVRVASSSPAFTGGVYVAAGDVG